MLFPVFMRNWGMFKHDKGMGIWALELMVSTVTGSVPVNEKARNYFSVHAFVQSRSKAESSASASLIDSK